MPHPCALGTLGLTLLFGVIADSGRAQPAKEDKIKIVLRFSVDELDPKNPGDAFVECVVRNQTEQAVRVPVTYTGGYENQVMTLYGGPLTLVMWAGDKKAMFDALAPGKERSVFKAPLKELLLLDLAMNKPLKPAEKRYYWSWRK